jgi:hypothetical protein
MLGIYTASLPEIESITILHHNNLYDEVKKDHSVSPAFYTSWFTQKFIEYSSCT